MPNAIDTLLDALDDYHGYVASDPTEPDGPAYAALARVEALLQAAEEHARFGHAIGCPADYALGGSCMCGLDALAAAVRRVTGADK